MQHKTTIFFILAVALSVGVTRYLLLAPEQGEPTVNSVKQGADYVNKVGTLTEAHDAQAKQIKRLEKKLKRVTQQLSVLQKSTSAELGYEKQQSQGELNLEDLSDERESNLQDYDPMSPEAAAIEDEIQNNYVNQVDDLYFYEEVDAEWAGEMENNVLAKLTDIESFSSRTNVSNEPGILTPEVSVSSFACRTNLCGTEIVAGSVDEMIAYQHFMIDQTKRDLPSIVFSTIEPFGSKYKMKAYLARDEYEFPQPR